MAEAAMMQPNEKTQGFLGQVLGSVAGAMMMRLCAMGDELGLFKELAKNGPASSWRRAPASTNVTCGNGSMASPPRALWNSTRPAGKFQFAMNTFPSLRMKPAPCSKVPCFVR